MYDVTSLGRLDRRRDVTSCPVRQNAAMRLLLMRHAEAAAGEGLPYHNRRSRIRTLDPSLGLLPPIRVRRRYGPAPRGSLISELTRRPSQRDSLTSVTSLTSPLSTDAESESAEDGQGEAVAGRRISDGPVRSGGRHVDRGCLSRLLKVVSCDDPDSRA